jgi:hypothetical protein
MGPFDIGAKHIERLDPLQLSRLLKRLLYLEAVAYGIPFSAPHVPLEINVPDGGEDGRIEWESGVDKTDFLPKRFTLFQVKAKEMSPAECYKEILKRDEKNLKDQVTKVLDAGGAYIIFCEKAYVKRHIDERVKNMRVALKAAGRNDCETAYIEFYDGNKIAAWVNKYFAAQVDVMSCVGFSIPWGLKTWEHWASNKDYEFEYVLNTILTEHIRALREHFTKDKHAVVRVRGLSGLGKTRLALELFRSEEGKDDLAVNVLRSNVIYFDAAGGGDELVRFIGDTRNRSLCVLLVVDNCEPELHRRLGHEIRYKGPTIGLLTIDFSIEEVNGNTRTIHITQDDCKGIVKGILKKNYQGLGDPVISRIEEFAQDFPSIAVLLAKQVQQGVEDIGRLSDDQFARKLLWGRESEDENIIKVIRACSLFDYIEFSEDEYTNNIRFLSKDIAQVSEKTSFEICKKYLKLGILQKRGRFIRVCPIPLAIKLAAEWWDITPTNEILRFIENLTESGLIEQFCEQGKKLHFSSKAKTVVEKLCGPQGPFGKSEVLLSNEGSRLFRSMVEVNPQATIEALWVAVADKSRDQLLDIKNDVRRNLVRALEKICRWDDTFDKGAKLLLRLAAAENESWRNNATGQFLQLFHIYLSGTLANLKDRLLIVREALASKVKEEQELGIRALGRGLKTHSFSRMGGVESQGSRVPKRDYEPTGQEIREYWQECIRLMREKILLGGELATKAKQELGTNIGGLVRNGMIEEVEDTIEAVTNQGWPSWAECLTAVRHLLDFDGTDMPADIRARILHLESILQPKGIREKLRLMVSIPDWRDRKNEEGDYISISAEEADKLARQLAGDNLWFKDVQVILEGEQRQSYAFGKALGQSISAGLRREFVKVCLSILAELGREKGNPDVLGAFLGNVSDEGLVGETMEKVIQDEKLWGFAVWLTRFLDLTEKHLRRLLPLVRQNKIPVSDIRVFSYGRALDKLPEGFVAEFCHTIANHSQEGANCALDVLYMYCHQNDERFAKCVQTFRNIVMRKGLLIGEKQSQMAGHNWEVVSNKLLRIDKDVELAKHLAMEIVGICGSDEVQWDIIHYNAKNVLEVLLKEYFEACWDIIGRALISKDWSARHYLEDILGPGHEEERSKALIAEVPQDELLKWCKKNDPHGPAVIAHLTPIFSSEKEKASWHPLARKLIDDFGGIKEVRAELDSNICSFMSWGSRAPYYQKRIDLLSELLLHPIKEVCEWADSSIKYFEKERDEASRETEEWEWGIH